MQSLPVPLGARAYDVLIGQPELDRLAAAVAAAVRSAGEPTGVAVLVDARVAETSTRASALLGALSARLPRVQVLRLAPGEACKRLSELEKTCEWLAAAGHDRGAVVVGLGGGAATDHAGFAAAIYQRGIDFVLVPTTLLAMVDASVGGKTAVDLAAGKNLVGAFHQPRGVICDLGFLDTLPARELAAGLAEVVKAGLIADAALFAAIEAVVATGQGPSRAQLAEWIAAAVRVKIDVVVEDERERGRRAILNFGHTVGHAIEAASGYDLLHGEAVALGMLAALELGRAVGVGSEGLGARVRAVLAGLGLPVDVQDHLDAEVLERLVADKKRRRETLRFVLVPEPGQAVLRELPLSEVKARLAASYGVP